MSELRVFKFVATLVIEFKKIESDDSMKYSTFYSNSKAETIVNEIDIDKFLDQFMLQLYQTYKSHVEKFLVGLLIQF